MTKREAPANAPAVQVASQDAIKAPGEFIFTRAWDAAADAPPVGILYMCPCGCGVLRGINFKGWAWDGNLDKPSCTPSLGCHPKDGNARDGSGYHWHGYLRAGVFEEC